MNTKELSTIEYTMKGLYKIERSLHNLDERNCLGYDNETQLEKAESRRVVLELRASELAEKLDLQIYHQGDCRGCALYLIDNNISFKDIATNYSSGFACYNR